MYSTVTITKEYKQSIYEPLSSIIDKLVYIEYYLDRFYSDYYVIVNFLGDLGLGDYSKLQQNYKTFSIIESHSNYTDTISSFLVSVLRFSSYPYPSVFSSFLKTHEYLVNLLSELQGALSDLKSLVHVINNNDFDVKFISSLLDDMLYLFDHILNAKRELYSSIKILSDLSQTPK